MHLKYAHLKISFAQELINLIECRKWKEPRTHHIGFNDPWLLRLQWYVKISISSIFFLTIFIQGMC